jgi:hypothetical protein
MKIVDRGLMIGDCGLEIDDVLAAVLLFLCFSRISRQVDRIRRAPLGLGQDESFFKHLLGHCIHQQSTIRNQKL